MLKKILKWLFGEPKKEDTRVKEIYDNMFQPKIKDGDE